MLKLYYLAGLKSRFYIQKDKGDYLVKKFPSGLEYAIVEDVEAEGGFDRALKGVDAVEHIASPFHYNEADAHKVVKCAFPLQELLGRCIS